MSEAELEELLSYAKNPFEHPDAPISFPLEDDSSLTISSFVAMLESFDLMPLITQELVKKQLQYQGLIAE